MGKKIEVDVSFLSSLMFPQFIVFKIGEVKYNFAIMAICKTEEDAIKLSKDNGWFWCVKGEWTNCDPMIKKMRKKKKS